MFEQPRGRTLGTIPLVEDAHGGALPLGGTDKCKVMTYAIAQQPVMTAGVLQPSNRNHGQLQPAALNPEAANSNRKIEFEQNTFSWF